jgi:hypothetical protein
MKIESSPKTISAIVLGLTIVFLIIGLFTLLEVPTTIAITNDTVEIAVNITALSEITVTPAYLEWLDYQPTQVGSAQNLDIKNTGSTDFTKLWAVVDSFVEENTNPLGVGNPALYTAGSFLVMRNQTDSEYKFVTRMEWNETIQPTGMTINPTDSITWGYFRNASSNYLFDFNDSSTPDECLNGTEMEFKIKTTAESIISPDRDMNSGTTTGTFEANTTEWGLWTFSAGPLQDYCVYVHKSCAKLMLSQWNWNTTLPSCSDRWYISQENFNPDDVHTLSMRVFIPRGVPSGNTTQSTLTIFAEA